MVKIRPTTVVITATFVLAACREGGDDTSPTVLHAAPTSGAVSSDSTAWSFTDDRGTTIELDEAPRTIVAYENAAGALLPLGVDVAGVFGSSDVAESPQLEGLDVTGVESVGRVYGELNMEAVAALEPDLIVSLYDPEQEGPAFGFVEDGEATAAEIAPVLVIDGGSTADARPTIERFVELAGSMGALDEEAVAAARQRFDEALADLGTAVEANPGVDVVAMASYAGEGIYFARPENFASLRLFGDAGVELVEPDGEPGDPAADFVQFFYDFVSFEQAAKYPADLILVGNNAGAMDAAEITADAAFADLPAVAAGEMEAWRMIDAFSYDRFAGDIEALAEALAGADPERAG